MLCKRRTTMKKVLSISLIIVMLWALIAMPLGANAVENSYGGAFDNIDEKAVTMPSVPDKGVVNLATGATAVPALTKPTYNEATLGNYMANYTDQQRAEHLATINAELMAEKGVEYVPVVDSKRAGVTPDNAILFSEIADDGYYYLWEDITWSATIKSAASGSGSGASKYELMDKQDPSEYVDDVIIDGCGHTINMTADNLFLKSYNVILNNLTVTRANPVEARSKQLHVLARWEMRGYSSAENVTFDVDYDIITNTDSSEGLGAFAYTVGNGSYVKNVLNTSTINIGADVARMQRVAGFVSVTSGTVLLDTVVNRGVININGANLSVCDNIGGIVGYTSTGTTTFRNCFNEMDINIKHGSVLGTGARLGGIVGSVFDQATFENCVSSGTITIGESGKTAFSPKLLGVGGIVGITSNPLAFNNCFSDMNVVVKNGVDMGDINIGGIIAEAPEGTTFKNCENSGNITVGEGTGDSFDPKIKNIGGIVGAITGNANVELDGNSNENTYTFDTCFNKGKIWLKSDISVTAVRDIGIKQGVAGIAGLLYGTAAFKNCVNTGNIVSDAQVLKCFSGIAGAGQGTAISFNNCINSGNIDVFQHGNESVDAASAGGIMAYQYIRDARVATFYNCTNNGNITDLADAESAPLSTDKLMKGGIAAVIRGVKDVKFYNCINNGDVLSDAVSNMSHAGGIVGVYGSLGNWMGSTTVDSTFTVEKCTNNGHVSSLVSAAGVLGTTFELHDESKNGIVHYMSFTDVLNTGRVDAGTADTAGNAGGIAGYVAGEYTKISVVFERCENTAAINNAFRNTGGIAGRLLGMEYAPHFYLNDCENTGNIYGPGELGGIVGAISTSESGERVIDPDDYVAGTTVQNCVNNKGISGGANAAGIVAYTTGTDDIPMNINNCYNGSNGTISITSSTAAGIVAYQEKSNFSIENCYNMGSVTTTSPGCWLGGVIARIDKDTNITNCHNYASITYNKDAYYNTSSGGERFGGIGGVVCGIEKAVTVNVTDCSNSGNISLTDGAMNACIGGIMGQAWNGSTVTFTRCVNDGNISAKARGNQSNYYMGVAGILGTAGRASIGSTVYFYGCTNNGDVTAEAGTLYYSIGGILGLIAKGSATFDRSGDTVCANTGAVSAAGTQMEGVGGILGRAMGDTNEVSVTNTINEGEIEMLAAGDAKGVGGILGTCQDGNVTVGYCYNTANITNSSTVERTYNTGMGGIIGFLFGLDDRADISYCENSATIRGTQAATRLYIGGAIGCLNGDDYEATVNYFVNSGAISGGEYVGGAIGFMRTNNAPEDFKVVIQGSTNLDNLTASSAAAGMLGYVSINGTANTVAIDIKNCMNLASVGGTYFGGGMVGAQNTGAVLTYNIANCIFNGQVSGDVRAGIIADADSISNSTISGCILGAKVASGSGTAYTVAPEGFTVTDCSVLSGIGGTNSYSVTTLADQAALESALGAIENTESGVKGMRIYERENIKNMYLLAAEVSDSSVYGDRASEFETARNTAKNCGVFPLSGNPEYFTATQVSADSAYSALYNIMYVFDPASFTIYIPDSIVLEEQQLVVIETEGFHGASEFRVNVSGDFTLTNPNEPGTYVKYYIETEDDRIINSADTLFTVDESNKSVKNHYFTPRVDRENSQAVPGTYRGKITFAIQYAFSDEQ